MKLWQAVAGTLRCDWHSIQHCLIVCRSMPSWAPRFSCAPFSMCSRYRKQRPLTFGIAQRVGPQQQVADLEEQLHLRSFIRLFTCGSAPAFKSSAWGARMAGRSSAAITIMCTLHTPHGSTLHYHSQYVAACVTHQTTHPPTHRAFRTAPSHPPTLPQLPTCVIL